jgi:hypothetical protein
MIATPHPIPVATPMAVTATPLPKVSPDGVPLQRFVAAKSDPNMPNAGATWRTYTPGQAPPAKTLTLDDLPALAERGELGEKLYLSGDFRVTASSPNGAVLRHATRPDTESPRVVVKYPAGFVPPNEREKFTRDSSTPFEIYDVRRAPDGVVTVWVREIIKQ